MVVFRDGSRLPDVPAHRVDAGLAPKRHLHLHVRTSRDGDARYEYDSRDVLLAGRIRRQLHHPQLRVADLLRTSQQLGPGPGWSPHRTWHRLGAMRDDEESCHFPIRKAVVASAEQNRKTVPLVMIRSRLTKPNT